MRREQVRSERSTGLSGTKQMMRLEYLVWPANNMSKPSIKIPESLIHKKATKSKPETKTEVTCDWYYVTYPQQSCSSEAANQTFTFQTELLGFWTFPASGILENRKHDVSETGSVSVLRWGGKTPAQLGPLERANLNILFYFLEYRTMGKVKKHSNSVCYTPLSQPFRIYSPSSFRTLW
jgi:hypothetical protein